MFLVNVSVQIELSQLLGFKKIQRGDAYEGFIKYFHVYLDKITILKTRLDWSIQLVEPRIEPKINLIKTKKGKKSVKPKKKNPSRIELNQKIGHFFGSLTGIIFKTIDKAHGYSAKQ